MAAADGHEGPHVEASPYHDVDFGLADVEAKQQILNLIGSPGPMVLRLLALPFATHPDYLEAWRP